MLLGPIIHYTLEYLFLLLLSFDSLGFIVTQNKSKSENESAINDHARLVFSWVYILSLKSLNCCCCCIPLIDELVLLGIIFFALPILRGTEKVNNFLLRDNGLKKTFQVMVDLVINKIMPHKNN